MAKTKKVESVEQTNIQKITKNPFIFMDETLQGLEIAFQRRENIILWGSGGYGKSDIAQYFFNILVSRTTGFNKVASLIKNPLRKNHM